MLDLFWARNLTPANFDRYMKVENFAFIRDAHTAHNGIIYLALHFGSHEWVSLAGGFKGLPRVDGGAGFQKSVAGRRVCRGA